MSDEQHQKPPRYECDELRNMAYDLIKRHPELLKDTPNPSNILFVMDRVNEPTSHGKALLARTSKITARVIDFIDAGDKEFMIEWFQRNNGYLTINQAYLLMAQQLLLFGADGNGSNKITGWDVQEMEVIADRFGLHALDERHGDVPDVMDGDFNWGRVGQLRIETVLRQQGEQRRKAEAMAERQTQRTEQATLNNWQPAEPLVKKDNVVAIRSKTGTH